ncbi:hypothetical protein GE061_014026 [Apolygus lucorum]|uniref:Uncharacterized protein n=1 Tax=Apolygus lucorum TaxID=248454 RepID=A0A6A4K723_APOLU|nr:hypothetical protein GE061_014026 [Apolygus lucorum]
MGKDKAVSKNKKCRCIIKSHKGYCTHNVRCPHMPSKHDLNPEEIARRQYFQLLCSLKGNQPQLLDYDEWDEEDEDDEEEELRPLKRIACRGKMAKIPERSYVHSFLAEVWSLLTPEMINRLKEMLVTEFNMSSEEADQFIKEQRAKTILNEPGEKKVKGFVVRRGRKCVGIRHYYSSQFNKIVSAKLADYLVASLSARRTKNQRKISEFLLRNLCDITGEKFTLQYPKTLAHKMMVFGTDTVAGWLAERVAEAEDLIRDDREVEELKAAKKKREKEKKKEADKQAKAGDKQPKKEASKPEMR